MTTLVSRDMSRAEALAVWQAHTSDLVDAFIAADVDPDDETTPTDAIVSVIVGWIEAGDECASC